MAHFNFVISQNAKWRHAAFYIDCHRMTVPENILLQKSTGSHYVVRQSAQIGLVVKCIIVVNLWSQTHVFVYRFISG